MECPCGCGKPTAHIHGKPVSDQILFNTEVSPNGDRPLVRIFREQGKFPGGNHHTYSDGVSSSDPRTRAYTIEQRDDLHEAQDKCIEVARLSATHSWKVEWRKQMLVRSRTAVWKSHSGFGTDQD